jgi:HTH-type transcriptional regulator/antitoxin HipB
MGAIIRNLGQLGAAVRRRRRELGLSQEELARRVSLRQGTISTLEKGDGAQLGTILNVLAALDMEFVVRTRTKANPSDIEALF